jgi:hypothetical protein
MSAPPISALWEEQSAPALPLDLLGRYDASNGQNQAEHE